MIMMIRLSWQSYSNWWWSYEYSAKNDEDDEEGNDDMGCDLAEDNGDAGEDGGVGDNDTVEDRGYSPTRGVFSSWASCSCLSLAASKRVLCSKFAKSQHGQPNPTTLAANNQHKQEDGLPNLNLLNCLWIFTLRNWNKDNFYAFTKNSPASALRKKYLKRWLHAKVSLGSSFDFLLASFLISSLEKTQKRNVVKMSDRIGL